MKLKLLTIAIAAIANMVFTPAALAKKHKREGFNFGASLRMLDVNDDSLTGDDTYDKSRVRAKSQAVSPHIGYVFAETLNVGLNLNFEESVTDERDVSADLNKEIERHKETSTKSASLFMRFLFAKVMYFEWGFGLYDSRTNSENEYTLAQDDGTFSLTRESYSTRGVGPGYHVGMGLEIPAANGFFFTVAHVTRNYHLRDFNGTGDLGAKRRQIRKQEFSFGISHYVD